MENLTNQVIAGVFQDQSTSQMPQKNHNGIFYQLLDELVDYYRGSNIEVKAYHPTRERAFERLAPIEQAAVLEQCRGLINVFKMAAAPTQEETIKPQQLLWSALKIFNLTPTADLFSVLKPDHALEIYDLSHRQIWRNVEFMKVCSYTLEEVLCFPWPDRYERDIDAQAKTFNALKDFLNNSPPRITAPFVTNTILEKFGQENLKIKACHEYLAPLFNKEKEITHYLVASRVAII